MRHNRILKPNATYHVTVRANRKEMILYCDMMRALFFNTIKRAKRRYRFQVHNFCIMGNHIHLIIHPEQNESLSRIMQWILSVFAMAWNRKHLVSGHVWGERFFSKVLDSIRDFIKTFIYVIQNPINAQIVGRADEWEFGGLWHFKEGNCEILEGLPGLTLGMYHLYYRLLIINADT
ncbi:REP-associated tyrosine transposase [Treponema primitia]